MQRSVVYPLLLWSSVLAILLTFALALSANPIPKPKSTDLDPVRYHGTWKMYWFNQYWVTTLSECGRYTAQVDGEHRYEGKWYVKKDTLYIEERSLSNGGHYGQLYQYNFKMHPTRMYSHNGYIKFKRVGK